jgi:hypothetical protein
MAYPEGYLWDYPGIYSLTVPYGSTNDFFYSGHVGCSIICALEYWSLGWKKMSYFSLTTCLAQTSLMISMRGHYTIDLITGIIMGHYVWMLAERHSYLIDVKLFKIPLNKRF